MPRRRGTRKNQTSRMRPVLPEGDLDSSMSINERKAKLDTYLKDLNTQVQERVETMKARGYEMICKVKGAFSLEILKLPMNIRKMKLSDYEAQGGEVNETALNEASNLLTEMTRSVLQPTTKAATRDPFTELGNLPLKFNTPSGRCFMNTLCHSLIFLFAC
ncbi:borealin-like [Stylophora pistillata]|uniref:borealin-like n=1 Tax=Stylophora pistillata TaxID=50429 RepID=UPI000C0502F3|nr:borealin-like [Stylophora pistillata]